MILSWKGGDCCLLLNHDDGKHLLPNCTSCLGDFTWAHINSAVQSQTQQGKPRRIILGLVAQAFFVTPAALESFCNKPSSLFTHFIAQLRMRLVMWIWVVRFLSKKLANSGKTSIDAMLKSHIRATRPSEKMGPKLYCKIATNATWTINAGSHSSHMSFLCNIN